MSSSATRPSRPTSTSHKAPLWAREPVPEPVPPPLAFLAGLRNHHIANTAYPIAHRRTIWRWREPAERHAERLERAFGASNWPQPKKPTSRGRLHPNTRH